MCQCSKISCFLAHRIRISEILPLDYPGCRVRAIYIGCIGTHTHMAVN